MADAWCCALLFRKISRGGAKYVDVMASGSLCGNQCEWCITQTLNKTVMCLLRAVVHETVNDLPVLNMHSASLSMVHSLVKST
jgi:hypothetical protein